MFYIVPMHSGLSHKTKQLLTAFVKIAILCGASFYIYSRLTNNGQLDLSTFISRLERSDLFQATSILLVLGLTILNWLLEILKWQQLVRTTKAISYGASAQQSLAALTASLITPNRVGEYGAKAVYYAPNHRRKVLFLNFWGNMTQMGVTLVLGAVGCFYFFSWYAVEVDWFRIFRLGILFFAFALLIVFAGRKASFQIKGFSIKSIRNFILKIGLNTHLVAISLSVLRYATFSFQYYYLLSLFGLDLGYIEAMVGISSMYILASIIPTLTLFDVIIKGTAGVWVFGYLGVDELTVLSTTTSMWLLNFVLPSIFGGYYVLNFRWNAESQPN